MNTEQKQGTMADFLKDAGISMTAVRAPGNPNMPDADSGMTHYRVTFTRKTAPRTEDKRTALKFKMSVYFSMGAAHTKPPTAGEVLDCLASDAAGVETAQGFDDWCGEYGYNTDSRKAFKVYDACRKQAAELKAFLGDDLYARLLYATERG